MGKTDCGDRHPRPNNVLPSLTPAVSAANRPVPKTSDVASKLGISPFP
jgi:hypothetical protein